MKDKFTNAARTRSQRWETCLVMELSAQRVYDVFKGDIFKATFLKRPF